METTTGRIANTLWAVDIYERGAGRLTVTIFDTRITMVSTRDAANRIDIESRDSRELYALASAIFDAARAAERKEEESAATLKEVMERVGTAPSAQGESDETL